MGCPVRFGMQFFPDVTPEQKSAQSYFADALNLVGLCDTRRRIPQVEHDLKFIGPQSRNPTGFRYPNSARRAGYNQKTHE